MSFTANTCLEIFNAMPTAEQQKFKTMITDSGTKPTKKQHKKTNHVPFIKAKILAEHNKRHKQNQ